MFQTHIFPLILLLLGLGLMAGAGVSFWRTVRLLQRGVEAAGEVVALEENHDSDGTSWQPVVEFTTPLGERVRFTAQVSRKPARHRIGDAVAVLYDPQNAREARIKSFVYLWFPSLLFGILGTAFTWISTGQLMGVIPTH